VDGDRHHARLAIERRLDAVAVMRVDVQVDNPVHLAQQPLDHHHRVIEDAEAGRPVGERVVQSTGEVERYPAPGEHLLRRHERGAGADPGRLVHPQERLIVA